MAWPDDARYVNYAVNQMVKSAELNEFQDKIYANHARSSAHAVWKAAYLDQWSVFNLNPIEVGTQDQLSFAVDSGVIGYWSYPGGTGHYFFFQCPVPTAKNAGDSDTMLNYVHAKVYNGDSSAHDWTLEVLMQNLKIDAATSTDAPTGSQLDITAATSVGATGYKSIGSALLSQRITSENSILAVVGPTAHVDDRCYGVQFSFQKMYY